MRIFEPTHYLPWSGHRSQLQLQTEASPPPPLTGGWSSSHSSQYTPHPWDEWFAGWSPGGDSRKVNRLLNAATCWLLTAEQMGSLLPHTRLPPWRGRRQRPGSDPRTGSGWPKLRESLKRKKNSIKRQWDVTMDQPQLIIILLMKYFWVLLSAEEKHYLKIQTCLRKFIMYRVAHSPTRSTLALPMGITKSLDWDSSDISKGTPYISSFSRKTTETKSRGRWSTDWRLK